MLARTCALIILNITIFDISFLQFKLFSNTKLLHSLLINLLIALALKNMTSQKRDPTPPPRRDSHQHWPFLVAENNEDSLNRLLDDQATEVKDLVGDKLVSIERSCFSGKRRNLQNKSHVER